MQFDQAKVNHLPALQSNHCPLFIFSNDFASLNALDKPFRFQATWMTHDNFSQFIHEKWNIQMPLIPLLQTLSKDL